MSKPSRRPNREARKAPRRGRVILPDAAGKRSYELKLDWAFAHFQTLRTEVERWERDCYRVTHEPDPKTGENVLWANVSEDPPARGWGLIVGDCVHNMRSCLDHLALDLARSFTNPLPQEAEEGSEFPVYWKSPMGLKPKKRKIGSMDPLAQAEIEDLQPHLRGADYTADPLWRIHELDRIDKHRLLHVVAAVSVGSQLAINHGDVDVTTGERTRLSKGRTELARYTARPIEGRVDMQLNPVMQVAIQGIPALQDLSVLKTLEDLFSYLKGRVFPVLTPFLK